MVRLHVKRLFCTLACAGCASVTGADDVAGACRQTSEFGNYGCILITGQVTGAGGETLSGTAVQIGNGGDRAQFGGGFDTTNAAGRYELRAIRVLRDRGATDSVTLWIHAYRGLRLSPLPPLFRDSVRVRIAVTPIGAVPPATVVDLTLPAL